MKWIFCFLFLFINNLLPGQQYIEKYKEVDSLLSSDKIVHQIEGKKLLETKYLKDSLSSSYWLMMARANEINMRQSKVFDNINKAIQLDPKNDEAFFEKAKYYHDREGEIEAAYQTMNECLSISKKAIYYFYKGIYAQLLKKNEEAMDHYDKTIRLNYNEEGLFRNYAILLWQSYNPQKALEMINKAIALNENASNYHTQGQVYGALLDLDNMCKSFKNAYAKGYKNKNDFDNLICKDQTGKNKHKLLGDAFYLIKNFRYAILAYTKALQTDPDSSSIIMNIGVCHYELKDYDKAKRDLLKSLTLKNPDYDMIYRNLSVVSFDQNNFQESIEYCSERIKRDSNHFVAYLDRGSAYRKLKQYDKAEADYNKSLQIKPDFYRALGYKAYLYLELGETKKALEYANKAIEINPEYGYAYIVRGNLKLQFKQPDYCNDFEKAKLYGEVEEAEKAIITYCKK